MDKILIKLVKLCCLLCMLIIFVLFSFKYLPQDELCYFGMLLFLISILPVLSGVYYLFLILLEFLLN